jgi:hypothetical protein
VGTAHFLRKATNFAKLKAKISLFSTKNSNARERDYFLFTLNAFKMLEIELKNKQVRR